MCKVTQIGWYHLKEDSVFYNTFEFAAWYEKVSVKSGRYPVTVCDFRVLKHANPKYNNRIEASCNSAYVTMDGVILEDDFGTRFCGMATGNYDKAQNVGKLTQHKMHPYLYEIAESVISGTGEYELFPEFECREIVFQYDGEPCITHGIYLK